MAEAGPLSAANSKDNAVAPYGSDGFVRVAPINDGFKAADRVFRGWVRAVGDRTYALAPLVWDSMESKDSLPLHSCSGAQQPGYVT